MIHYPEEELKKLGAVRKKCKICGRYFWTLDKDREICGDHETYSFIDNPYGKKLSYYEVWKEFSEFMEKRGYKPIKRYPVVARWRDDIYFVIASIADFQPWVTDGLIKPPSKKLTVPQVCLRFNDIENVGLTGRHYTSFVMIGQHAFVPPEEYDINIYFNDLLSFFENIKLPIEKMVFHEDKWEGGGNGGTSIEFFLGGLEIANQVYMQYKVINNEWVELQKLKVLDMGMGQERLAWITNGTPTSYDIVFPNTKEFLLNNLKIDIDYEILKKISSFSSTFDFNEKSIKDFEEFIKNKLGKDYKNEIEVMRAVYSILDHLRTLYIAISDGALPSNIGGNYNLRFIARRMFLFLDKYFDNIEIIELLNKISEDWYEKELKDNINEIADILNFEYSKYIEVKKNASKILSKIENIDSKKLFELYTSYGISPEIVKEFKGDIKVDKEFYELLEKHKEISKEKKGKEEIFVDVSKYQKTIKIFYKNWRLYKNVAKIIGKIDNYYIFDSTVFYPLKGGQINDIGYIFNINKIKKFSPKILDKLNFEYYVKKELEKHMNGDNEDVNEFGKYYTKINEVIDYGGVILHKFENEIEYQSEDEILQIIDKDRRYRASRHHTAAHILEGVLRRYYGKHIWQAGAEKNEFEGKIDITHYRLPTLKEIHEIEYLANKIVLEDLPIYKFYITRDVAEKIFGFTIYQGGFIPEKRLRIVNISNFDVEACSGTHLDRTGEVGLIKITKVEKIADGIIRFYYVAGDRVIDKFQELEEKIYEIKSKINVNIDNLSDYINKIDRERNELNKKYNYLLEEVVKQMIKDGKIIGKLNINMNDILKIILKYQDKIEYINLELNDGIISSENGDKKVGKFFIKIKN